jgi:hypothetical protein
LAEFLANDMPFPLIYVRRSEKANRYDQLLLSDLLMMTMKLIVVLLLHEMLMALKTKWAVQ